MIKEKKERPPLPPHKQEIPCIKPASTKPVGTPAKIRHYDAFPRDCEFAYMTPGYYATGFGILDVYRAKVDVSEMRSLLFLEDPKQEKKWGSLKRRIPFAENRVTDLPGTRAVHYRNYCLRCLAPESASSWRKSILQNPFDDCNSQEEDEIVEQDEEAC